MAKPKQLEPFADLPGERFLDVSDVARMFPSRGRRWVIERVKAGEFGTVLRDAGGWLIPLSGLREYVRARVVDPSDLAPELQPGAANLVQLRKP